MNCIRKREDVTVCVGRKYQTLFLHVQMQYRCKYDIFRLCVPDSVVVPEAEPSFAFFFFHLRSFPPLDLWRISPANLGPKKAWAPGKKKEARGRGQRKEHAFPRLRALHRPRRGRAAWCCPNNSHGQPLIALFFLLFTNDDHGDHSFGGYCRWGWELHLRCGRSSVLNGPGHARRAGPRGPGILSCSHPSRAF